VFAPFPLLLVTVSLYGLIASPAEVTQEFQQFTALLRRRGRPAPCAALTVFVSLLLKAFALGAIATTQDSC
jgi:hypothetical protein